MAPGNTAGGAVLQERLGAFVTLRVDGDLRGCVGMLLPERPLNALVPDLAVSASTEDDRFAALTVADLPRLVIEISILTPAERIASPAAIEVGRHGLLVTRGATRGVLLPQVATEQGWDRETFLAGTCRKAGLDADAWRAWAAAGRAAGAGRDRDSDSDRATAPGTPIASRSGRAGSDLVVEIFTAEVFGEDNL